MTKLIRIENADTSDHKIVVEIYEKSQNGDPVDVLVKTITLNTPTQLIQEHIWQGRYLLVKEV